jgi:hypothetical protein
VLPRREDLKKTQKKKLREPVITHLVSNFTSKINRNVIFLSFEISWIEDGGRGVTHNSEIRISQLKEKFHGTS